MQLFFDRDDDRGCIAVFVGIFEDREALINYAYSKYLGDDYTDEEFEEKLKEVFVPQNADRSVEEELREHFGAGMINQFSYDFAVIFDEDSSGADVRDFFTTSLRELISGGTAANINEAMIADFERRGIALPAPCNSFLFIPTIYEGYYSHIKKEDMELWYLGTYRP